MRKLALFLIVAFGVVALGMAAVAGRALRLRASPRNASGVDEKHSLNVDGTIRNYLLHVPALLPATPVPLVLVFHGGGHDWNMPGFTHFDDLADQENFVVAYPDAVNRHWNDSRGLTDASADDVAFTRALIADVSRAHPIDAHRIYATGISNGGFFSNRLACDLSDRIAAIASVAATMPKTLVPDCKPKRPVSVLYMHGTEDPLVPINGGEVGFVHGKKRGESISLADAAKFWRDVDHIPSTAHTKPLPDHYDDGTHVRLQVWSGGNDDTEVDVYTIEGGGHTWPGGPQYLPKFIVGKASQNLNATRAIWEFFQGQELP